MGRPYRSRREPSDTYDRSVTTTANRSWFVDADYDVDVFRELVTRTTQCADVPTAVGIERNVPIYDGAALHDIARDPTRRRDLLGEFADSSAPFDP